MIPDNLPTLGLKHTELGAGFTSVAVGDTLRTSDQYFAFHLDSPDWVLSSFFTSQKEVNRGRQTYRRVNSLSARLSVLLPVAQKYSRRMFSYLSRLSNRGGVTNR